MTTTFKILHLEDTPTDAELVERELKKANIQFEKLVVDNKRAFEKALKEFVPDIIISDHTLPSFDSLEAIKIIKRQGIKIPIILVTATVSDEYAVEIMKAGADDYILKDRLHRLPQAVLNAMETYSLKRAKEVIIDELIRNQLHLKEAQAVAKLGSWETNLQTMSVIWSEETHHIFETDPKTFHATHKAFFDFIHPEDRDKVKITFENSLNCQKLNSIEHKIISTNGTLKHIIENWRIFKDDKGHPVRAVGTCQDITESKLAEEEITKLSLVARKTSNAVVITDAAEKIQWVNEAFTRMTGFEINEIIGKKPGTFLQGPETDPVVVRYMRRRIRNRQAFECDIINYSKSGHKYWTRIQCQPEFDSTGKLTGFFSIQTDITKSKEAEQAIYKLTERLTLATSSAKIGIWDWDVVNNHVIWDNTMYQIFGVTEDKFSGPFETWAATVHPDDIEEENAKIHRALSSGTKFDFEFRILWPDKSIRYIKGDAIVMRDDRGKALRMIGTNLDITEKKKAEEKNRFKANLLNTIGQAAIATDINGIVNYWNRAAEDIYGWTPEEAIGKNILQLTPSRANREQALEIMDDLKNGRAWSGEFRVQRKDGTDFPAFVTDSPIYDKNNKLSGIVGISSDITEIKKLEELLEKTNRLAAVGSWEIDVVKGTVFWSDITKEIREVNNDYVPILGEGISYFKGSHKEIISQKIQDCKEHGTSWDEELQIITFKGNHKWVRTIGEGEFLNGKCIRIHGSFQDIDKLKNAEIKIRESEFRFRQIVETAQEGIWMLDENSETTFVNQKMCEIIGYSFDEMIGKTNFFFKDEANLQTAIDALKKRKQGISEAYKASFLTKDGRLIWTQISSNPIFDDAKKYKGSLWMVSDITEKLMADKMLLESEQKYRILASELDTERIRLVTAQSIAKVGSWETDLQTFQGNWSNETHRIFGSNPENFEASHSAFLDFIHPEDREKVDTAFKDSLYKCGSNSLEHRIITLQGVEKCIEENWTISRDEKGIAMVAVGTCQDITERKKEADKVIRNEAKLNLAQHIAQVGSWEVDMLSNERRWSAEFYRILGINEDVIPSDEAFLTIVHPDDKAVADGIIKNALSIFTDSSFQFRFVRKNGEIGYASSEWKVEFDSHRNPLYIHGILRDLTKEKKAESERAKMISDIVQRNSDLEQFSYMVSHNLRAPTANIIGFTGILQDKTLTPQEKKESLQGLSASVTGLDNTIKDINTILQSKHQVHEKKEILIFSKLVNDSAISLGSLIDKHRVRIISDFSEVDEINSLKIYLYSIFYNLISNSIKYGKPNEPPLIEIKSKKENGKIILIFKDNGLGIDMKNKGDKIFGLYNRFHSHVEGKGMGLFMVKTHVESLGGKITIATELNKGTEFTIVFEI